jgi:ribosomal protein L21E
LAKVTLANGAVVEGTVEELMQMAQVFGAPAFQIGDLVKPISPGSFGGVSVGTIGKITKGPDVDGEYRVDLLDYSDHDYFKPEQLVIVTVDETSLEYRKVEVRKPKVGDFVKFDDKFAEEKRYFTVGKYYEIIEIDEYGDPQIVDDDGDCYDTGGEDFEVYEKVSKENPKVEPFKVGDCIIPLTESDDEYSVTNSSMKLGKISKLNDNRITIEIIVHDRPQEVGHEHCVDPKYFRKATDEEVIKAQADATFSKLGRKLGEFKEGDIVYVNESIFQGFASVVSGPFGTAFGGNYYVRFNIEGMTKVVLGDYMKLIAPVESRVDGDSL